MFGMCQNVEIIHEHHHHFYQIIVPTHSRRSSSLSKTGNPNPNLPPTSSPKKSNQQQQTHTSRFYHSKRSCYGKNQRGIEVVCRKDLHPYSYQKINLQKDQNQQTKQILLYQSPFPKQQQRYFKATTHASHINTSLYLPQTEKKELLPHNEGKVNKSLSFSIENSNPSIEVKLNSQNSSSNKTKKNYLNCHQLKQSKLGFNSMNETKKRSRDAFNKTDYNIALSIPLDANKHKKSQSFHPNSQIYQKEDKDSLLTKKEYQFLTAFKTEKMFDDAKSIISRQSLDNSCINIEESIIISRSMDYFSHITPEQQFSSCALYLAKDERLNWIVSIRLFQFKHEHISLKESQIYSYLTHIHERERISFAVLNLYKIMIEGSGLHKNIFFVLQPYEKLLDDFIFSKKGYFRSVSSSFSYFLSDLESQLVTLLLQLAERRVFLADNLDLRDFVIVNEQYKLHSLSKFVLAGQGQIFPRQRILENVETLKKTVVQTVRSF